ncbi:LCB3 [Sanghuangporus sanghuang]
MLDSNLMTAQADHSSACTQNGDHEKRGTSLTAPSPSSTADTSTNEFLYAVGTAPEEFYTRTLAPWRATARRFIMQRLQLESEWIAKMQEQVRSPYLDAFFVYTSSLGTHTFFMIALPALFFFGFADIGRGLVFVLATGVYVSSFIKDLICVPRPYVPPVARLTIGSHHLEYGFPSTHSTNSVSIALYIYQLIHIHYFTSSPSIATTTYIFSCIFLLFYVFSIVLGRVYTGMHSLVDCVAGVTLGILVWTVHALYWGSIETWLARMHWYPPMLISLLCGLIVHWHPQPADDCPCFEDAIAFVSVESGILISHWMSNVLGYGDGKLMSKMPGFAWAFLSASSPISPTSTADAWRLSLIWWSTALLKLTLGISLIFIWRLIAKFFLHISLPALFRLVSIKILPKGMVLPHRRFYIPATEYSGAVPEPEGGLHPIPSVIDLPTMLHEEGGRTGRKEIYDIDGEVGGMKRRAGKGKGRRRFSTDVGIATQSQDKFEVLYAPADEASEDGENVKHYDADVLTKVIVYAGIGILASGPIPIMFDLLGLGVYP